VPRQSSSLENDLLAELLPRHTLRNHSLEELLERVLAVARRQLVAVLPGLRVQQQHALGRVVPPNLAELGSVLHPAAVAGEAADGGVDGMCGEPGRGPRAARPGWAEVEAVVLAAAWAWMRVEERWSAAMTAVLAGAEVFDETREAGSVPSGDSVCGGGGEESGGVARLGAASLRHGARTRWLDGSHHHGRR
jgi:hypothetical protein